MTKPNLLFPTPVWTIQLDNYKVINEEMYNFIKSEQTSLLYPMLKQLNLT